MSFDPFYLNFLEPIGYWYKSQTIIPKNLCLPKQISWLWRDLFAQVQLVSSVYGNAMDYTQFCILRHNLITSGPIHFIR